MFKEENNFAYIDGANLHKGVDDLGWKLDYKRLRLWLDNKYNIKRAYIFLGLIPQYADLYTYLQEVGFILIFKETVYGEGGKIKGNCDADLVLQTVCDTYENNFDKAVIVSSDGDYASLIKFLQERNKLLSIVSPSNHCSVLLKRTNARILYLDWVKSRVNKR
ncbi:MAG: NYN domain-containing protein [Candidatus Yanofskybacteria bacterium]|nr:NYN domain-containing protein [Candidatus Yanofskybacteria bacterium]